MNDRDDIWALNLELKPSGQDPVKNSEASREPHPGDLCPKCRQGKLDYDGLLNLSCPSCGYSISGCFT